MRPTTSDLATTFSHPEHVLPRATVDVGAKTTLFETALPEPADMTSMEMKPSFKKRVMAAHTLTKVNEKIAGTIVQSDSKSSEYNLQPPSTPVVKTPSDMRSEI